MNLRVAKALFKSFVWIMLTILFGLLQLWLVLGSSLLIRTFNVSYEKIFLDGVLLFFVTAVVTALATDYYFSDRPYPGWAETIMFAFFPFVIIVLSVWLFGICLGREDLDIDIEGLKNVEYAVLFMTFIYAIVVKFIEFFHEENLKK